MKLVIIINYLFRAYSMVLVLYALLSWLPGARESSLGKLISKLAEPYIGIFDRHIPSIGGISFNVIIALFVLNLVQRGFITLVFNLVSRSIR